MKRYVISLMLVAYCGSTFAEDAPKTSFSLSAGEEPEQKAWTQPASFSYTSSEGIKDSWAVDVAAKVEGQPFPTLPHTFFIRGRVQKNTLEAKEVEVFGAELGYAFDFDTAGHGPASGSPNLDAWYFFGDLTIGYADKAVFADPKVDCTVSPSPPACTDQRETSLRTTIKLMPFRSNWETTFFVDPAVQRVAGPSWIYSFSPVASLFHDQIVDAKRNTAGFKPTGGVTGVKIELNAAFSPRFTSYRLVLRGNYQAIQAFDRDADRHDNFEANTGLYKLSADFDLGRRSFESGVSGWVPTLGLTYTKGDDPLSARLDQDHLVASFKVTYRAQ